MKIFPKKLRINGIGLLPFKKRHQIKSCLATVEIFCKQGYLICEVNSLLKGGLV